MRLKMAEVKGGVKLPLFPSEPIDATVSQPYDYGTPG